MTFVGNCKPEKPDQSRVEIPVHITTSVNNYSEPSEAYPTPPVISVDDSSQVNEERRCDSPVADSGDRFRFSRLQPSQIPIYREKSQSTTNLSDPNGRYSFERPNFVENMYRPCQNQPQAPASQVNAQHSNQPFLHSSYPMYWNMPPEYQWGHRMFDYPREHFFETDFGRPTWHTGQQYVHPETFQPVMEDFGHSDTFPSTMHQQRPSRYRKPSPVATRQNYGNNRFSAAFEPQTIPIPNDRYRRESSEPPTTAYPPAAGNQRYNLDSFRNEISVLSDQVGQFTGCRHHSEFQRLQSALLRFLTVLADYNSSADQQSKQVLHTFIESVKGLIQELENKAISYEGNNLLCPGRGAIALPYESIEVPSQQPHEQQKEANVKSAEKPTSLDKFAKQLDDIRAWIRNDLEVQVEKFKNGQLKGDRDKNYAGLQEQITKTLCKCDTISGQSLSDENRKRRKETVNLLTSIAKSLENFHNSSTLNANAERNAEMREDVRKASSKQTNDR